MRKMKRLIALSVLIAVSLTSISRPIEAANEDAPERIITICEEVGAEYGICPEILEAMCFVESSYQNSATNKTCYGLMQINGAVWGYGYKSEYANIRKGAEILLGYCEQSEDIGLALDKYNGNSKAKQIYAAGQISTYSRKVLNKAEELERLHGK